MYRLDQHLLAKKIKEEEKYKTVLLLLIRSKDENTHSEKAPSSKCITGGVCIQICPTENFCQPVCLAASAISGSLPFVLASY